MLDYINNYYNFSARIGQRVCVDGEFGVIAEDRGHYLGVNFDSDKPGVVKNCHPTWEVEYGKMGKIRHISKSAARYRDYLNFDSGMKFIDFCRWKDRLEKV